MTPEAADTLRRAAAHVLVDDVEVPELSDAARHHVFRVLRVGDGESITVTDGAGTWRECVAAGDAAIVVGEVGHVARRSVPLQVAFAIPKHDRPEWIVQKLTELGLDRIVLLHAARSVVRWSGDRADKHLTKLRRVAAEAMQQSRGVWLPEIVGPLPALDVLCEFAAAEPGAVSGAGAARAEGGRVRAIAVGPEGGWSDDELGAASDTVRLATNVLRVETAAVVAGVALIWSDM